VTSLPALKFILGSADHGNQIGHSHDRDSYLRAGSKKLIAKHYQDTTPLKFLMSLYLKNTNNNIFKNEILSLIIGFVGLSKSARTPCRKKCGK
jgi:hypothetical protein